MRQQATAPQLFQPLPLLSPWLAAIAFASLILIGCSPQIGDTCEHDEDCPSGAFCDRTVQQGLCTISDCRPGDCPSESVCIEYETHDAFCMRSCDGDDDCRSDHQCIDDADFDHRFCFIGE